MKLRIRGNSIRLRLGQSEVTRLIELGCVEETTTFDPEGRHRLEYVLVSTPDVSRVLATCEGTRVVVQVPVGLAKAWGTTGRVGIEATQPIHGGAILKILIEKDFECLDGPPEEFQADAYPRPAGDDRCSP